MADTSPIQISSQALVRKSYDEEANTADLHRIPKATLTMLRAIYQQQVENAQNHPGFE